MLFTILRYAKAVAGALAAGVAELANALSDGVVTLPEWGAIVAAVLAGGGLVALVPNKPAASNPPAHGITTLPPAA